VSIRVEERNEEGELAHPAAKGRATVEKDVEEGLICLASSIGEDRENARRKPGGGRRKA